MLVLSRKTNERIVATLPDGRHIAFTVLEIRGDKVRLGIVAPKDVPVHRQEIHNEIAAEQVAALLGGV